MIYFRFFVLIKFSRPRFTYKKKECVNVYKYFMGKNRLIRIVNNSLELRYRVKNIYIDDFRKVIAIMESENVSWV